jgi:hypothetical protein
MCCWSDQSALDCRAKDFRAVDSSIVLDIFSVGLLLSSPHAVVAMDAYQNLTRYSIVYHSSLSLAFTRVPFTPSSHQASNPTLSPSGRSYNYHMQPAENPARISNIIVQDVQAQRLPRGRLNTSRSSLESLLGTRPNRKVLYLTASWRRLCSERSVQHAMTLPGNPDHL